MARVYIQVNGNGEIVKINNDAFLADIKGWLEIDEGEGDRYHHAQNNYLDGPLVTDEGIYRYRYIDGEVVTKTAEELQAEIDALPPPPMGDGEVMRILLNATSEKLPDDKALRMPERFDLWQPDTYYREGQIVRGKDDLLYRIVTPGGVTSLAHQQPWAEGMLSVYRPIVPGHSGTLDDPIPFVYGMDTTESLYYSHEGHTYLCKLTMPACVYPPGTPGLWQWELVA